MASNSSISWNEIMAELDQAPDIFLREASKLWHSKPSRKRRQEPQRLAESALKDTEQQTQWKALHDSVPDELLYFGEFKDKGEHVQLLQPVKVVKHTAKQIHIVAAYTLYCTCKGNDNRPVAWSSSPRGGLFGDFYTDWKPVSRYRFRRISKAHLFTPDVLKVPSISDSIEAEIAHMEGWKRLCSVCLFSNEKEYADWHLARYEETTVNEQTQQKKTRSGYRTTPPDFYAMLGIPVGASQQEIKAAYKRMAMKFHPDRGGCATKFHKVKMAYHALRENRYE